MHIDPKELEEVRTYLRATAIRRGLLTRSIDDIIQETIAALLPRWEEYSQSKKLFYRAKLALTDQASRFMAASEPVSGISFSAHSAAKRYLKANDNDVNRAYANQNTTVKVGRQLLQAVTSISADAAEYAPQILGENAHYLNEFDRPTVDDTRSSEIKGIIASTLTQEEAEVTALHIGMDGTALTMNEVAEELGITLTKARKLWRNARRKLESGLAHLVS